LAGQSLSVLPAGDCPTQGDATILPVTDGVVPIEGCIWGANGCSIARLVGANYDSDSDVATVVIETVDDSGPDEACTQALVALGYRVELQFKFQLPGTVVVVHDDVNGRQTIARQELDR
jgi:hypothetical protein